LAEAVVTETGQPEFHCKPRLVSCNLKQSLGRDIHIERAVLHAICPRKCRRVYEKARGEVDRVRAREQVLELVRPARSRRALAERARLAGERGHVNLAIQFELVWVRCIGSNIVPQRRRVVGGRAGEDRHVEGEEELEARPGRLSGRVPSAEKYVKLCEDI
jgi:hypothetical protein